MVWDYIKSNDEEHPDTEKVAKALQQASLALFHEYGFQPWMSGTLDHIHEALAGMFTSYGGKREDHFAAADAAFGALLDAIESEGQKISGGHPNTRN